MWWPQGFPFHLLLYVCHLKFVSYSRWNRFVSRGERIYSFRMFSLCSVSLRGRGIFSLQKDLPFFFCRYWRTFEMVFVVQDDLQLFNHFIAVHIFES